MFWNDDQKRGTLIRGAIKLAKFEISEGVSGAFQSAFLWQICFLKFNRPPAVKSQAKLFLTRDISFFHIIVCFIDILRPDTLII